MTPEQRERILHLCSLLKAEKDPQKFTELCKQLNEFLDNWQDSFGNDPQSDSLDRSSGNEAAG